MKTLMLVIVAVFPHVFQSPTGSRSAPKQQIICPVEKHSDRIIPIVYGKPTRATIARANRGELKTGGCRVSRDSPRHHCTKHNKSF